MLLVITITLLCLAGNHCFAFSATFLHKHLASRHGEHAIIKRNTQRNLIPLSNLIDVDKTIQHPSNLPTNGIFQFKTMDEPTSFYILCVAEEDDLPSVAQLTMDSFGSDALVINSEFSPIERSIIEPGVSLLNMYSNAVTYTEILSGLRSRSLTLMDRGETKTVENTLALPSTIEPSRSSIILVLAKFQHEEQDINKVFEVYSKDPSCLSNEGMVATVEIRLQPPDAKIPFSLPVLDKIERRIGQWAGEKNAIEEETRDLEPYLSNLCVSPAFRGLRIGKALVQSLEYIVNRIWKYNRIYLHVDFDNEAAMRLYKAAGYNDVEVRWNPFWAGEASKIGYFVKELS